MILLSSLGSSTSSVHNDVCTSFCILTIVLTCNNFLSYPINIILHLFPHLIYIQVHGLHSSLCKYLFILTSYFLPLNSGLFIYVLFYVFLHQIFIIIQLFCVVSLSPGITLQSLNFFKLPLLHLNNIFDLVLLSSYTKYL